MSEDRAVEEHIRAELDHMRGEVRAPHPAPRDVLARARRATAMAAAGAVLVAAAVVTGSIAIWRATEAGGPPAVPADTGEPSPTAEAPTGETGSAEVLDLRTRPLALPVLEPGTRCPTTPMTTITPGTATGFSGSAAAQQSGVVYLAFAGDHVLLRPQDRDADGWYSIKDVWVIGPGYDGPVLVRGGQIDGDGSMRMAWNPTTSVETALEIGDDAPSLQIDLEAGWRSVPMEVFIRAPGCYAYQLDGIGFTEFIVFEASR